MIFYVEGLATQVATGLRYHRCDSNDLPNVSPALRESKIRRASSGLPNVWPVDHVASQPRPQPTSQTIFGDFPGEGPMIQILGGLGGTDSSGTAPGCADPDSVPHDRVADRTQ